MEIMKWTIISFILCVKATYAGENNNVNPASINNLAYSSKIDPNIRKALLNVLLRLDEQERIENQNLQLNVKYQDQNEKNIENEEGVDFEKQENDEITTMMTTTTSDGISQENFKEFNVFNFSKSFTKQDENENYANLVTSAEDESKEALFFKNPKNKENLLPSESKGYFTSPELNSIQKYFFPFYVRKEKQEETTIKENYDEVTTIKYEEDPNDENEQTTSQKGNELENNNQELQRDKKLILHQHEQTLQQTIKALQDYKKSLEKNKQTIQEQQKLHSGSEESFQENRLILHEIKQGNRGEVTTTISDGRNQQINGKEIGLTLQENKSEKVPEQKRKEQISSEETKYSLSENKNIPNVNIEEAPLLTAFTLVEDQFGQPRRIIPLNRPGINNNNQDVQNNNHQIIQTKQPQPQQEDNANIHNHFIRTNHFPNVFPSQIGVQRSVEFIPPDILYDIQSKKIISTGLSRPYTRLHRKDLNHFQTPQTPAFAERQIRDLFYHSGIPGNQEEFNVISKILALSPERKSIYKKEISKSNSVPSVELLPPFL